jgi:hypothetical protein
VRTALIYHAGSELEEQLLTRWLSSFSELSGTLVIHEPPGRLGRRVRYELARVGPARLIDVLAFRLYYKLRLARRDRAWEHEKVARLIRSRYPHPPMPSQRLDTSDPNSAESVAFLAGLQADVLVARCRMLLSESVFSIPVHGTFVLHPGVVPEYRNSHGCFWALARRDLDRVGLTLLRIDAGVDTGPVYGYFTCDYDERTETHVVIQKRMVLDNLDAIRDRLLEISRGDAEPLDTSGRASRAWGQPWLSAYWRWKRRAKARA